MTSLKVPAVRIDRLVTLSVVAPIRGLLSRASSGLPILMYHSIAQDVDNTLHPYYRIVTAPNTFERQIELLRRDGYDGIALSEAISLLNSSSADGTRLSKKVVITFDDGFYDFYTDAFPVLERAGFKATVFLASAFIGKPFVTGRLCLDVTQIRALSDKGIEFGSHSVTHRRLVRIPIQEVAKELFESKLTIEDVTGRKVTLFSYPYRFPEENSPFTNTLRKLLDEYGYRGGVTTAIGRSSGRDDPRFLPRLPVNDCDDEPLLRAKLAGHYDWLRPGQRLLKQSRALWRSEIRGDSR